MVSQSLEQQARLEQKVDNKTVSDHAALTVLQMLPQFLNL